MFVAEKSVLSHFGLSTQRKDKKLKDVSVSSTEATKCLMKRIAFAYIKAYFRIDMLSPRKNMFSL